MKRLKTATNPESGTVSYEYDNNSNLSQRTDARGVLTAYSYDALNRVTTILYRINGQPDPNTGDVQYLYDNAASNGKGRPWLTYKWGTKPSHTAVGLYDVLGRVTQFYDLFGDGQGGWAPAYEIDRAYDLAGNVTSQTYPSRHSATYTYDAAGRTTSFGGTLGDGVIRSYASSFVYNARNQVTQELFGTQTPLYHKLQYNIRGQLWDVRVSTNSDINGNANRGCLQYFYDGSYGYGTSGPDNNGNVLFANTYFEDQPNGLWAISRQSYSYDSLNRLNSVAEYFVSNSQAESQQSLQSYTYDRWGNRTINPASWGAGINTKQFTVDTATNRLGVPSGQSGTMTYDNTGNLTTDTYSGYGSRTFDANNLIAAAQDSYSSWSYYTYNANGQRVRRNVANQETWEIYGIDGELLAEYPAFGATGSPQKEYGYRDGQLLITAEPFANIKWLVPDHLGTPRIILDLTGSLANVKRHDYLPFGEELFAGSGGRTTAYGYTSVTNAGGVRQQFTSKERDAETGLDYFGARYFASNQGRFTSADPYDINLERQYTSDPSDGDTLRQRYIIEPQRWNRYTYALNNPLKYIDPDGCKDEVYNIKILGEDFKVTISDKIKDQKVRDEIKAKIQEAADKINDGFKNNKLSQHEIKQIRSLDGIKVLETTPENLTKTGLHDNTYVLTAHRVQNSSAEFVAAEIVHESYHTKQWNYNCDNAVNFEKKASAFTVGVVRNLGFGPKVIDAFQFDALRGHTPCVKKKK